MRPTVSVLMPVFNGCRPGVKVLKLAIESILTQTMRDLELVVVNDGSTDETAEVVSSFQWDERVKLVHLPVNSGIVGALNAGLTQCAGQFIARQDADDYSVVTRLSHQVEFMRNNPEVALCGTRMWVVDKDGQILTEVKDRPSEDDKLRYFLKHTGCPFVHGSVMMRRESIEQMGAFSSGLYDSNSDYQHAEDYRLWVEFAKRDMRLANLPLTLYYHRNHGSKISAVHSGAQARATEQILKLAKQVVK